MSNSPSVSSDLHENTAFIEPVSIMIYISPMRAVHSYCIHLNYWCSNDVDVLCPHNFPRFHMLSIHSQDEHGFHVSNLSPMGVRTSWQEARFASVITLQ